MATQDTPLLEARGLTVRFGKVTALDGLDLTAPQGQVLAILGPNGAGKTTFVRTVATLAARQRRTAGARPGRRARSGGVRRDIGLAGQFAAVEPTMTGRENLEMTARLFGHGRGGAARAAAVVIEQLGLGEVADRRSGTYSGGQRRRLDLGASLVGGAASAAARRADDRPGSGGQARGLGRRPRARRRGTDILLTTHYLDEADELADQVVVDRPRPSDRVRHHWRAEGERRPGRDRGGRGRPRQGRRRPPRYSARHRGTRPASTAAAAVPRPGRGRGARNWRP